ncbi:hypothetical protein [Thermophilibacter provencensis]|uniref:DUF5648 domain-containing protein n=1 Tax=Thermophilibacter provencensis TaxID=1852386 RepID=A0ABT7V5R3_9ACTN|nr:hypothetical protein [Thermophilibacter provencensis]MDM8271943.1 hypothetical protein [Thermophilibacter provencensis]
MRNYRTQSGGLLALAFAVALSLGIAAPAQAVPGSANDDIGDAQELKVGVEDTGHTGVGWWDHDWYSFDLDEPGYVTLQFGSKVDDHYSLFVELFDSVRGADEHDYLYHEQFNALEKTNTSCKVGLPAGTYYLHVENVCDLDKYDYNTYSVKVNFTPAPNWETEINGELDVADPIKVGETINACTQSFPSTWSEYDYFTFEVDPQGGTYQVTFESSRSAKASWDLELLDENGDVVKQGDIFGQRYDFDGKATAHTTDAVRLDGGTYFVRIKGNQAAVGVDYKLTVSKTQTMYRLYNKYTGEHLYTASTTELKSLVALGWTDEGIGWTAPTYGDPVYRLYNPYAPGGDHHYTMSSDEYEKLKGLGWKGEGVAWHTAPSDGGVPLYRQFNPYVQSCTHNYTASKDENDALVELGWVAEGTAWYGVQIAETR